MVRARQSGTHITATATIPMYCDWGASSGSLEEDEGESSESMKKYTLKTNEVRHDQSYNFSE